MNDPLTPKERLVLRAASVVEAVTPDYRAIENGIWRALRMRGLLEHHRHGFAITELGRRRTMAPKPPTGDRPF